MFRTELTIAPVSQPLSRTSRVLTLGSCFADSLGQRLAAHKVAALTNPFGTVFQPLAASLLLRAAAGEEVDWQQHLVEARGRWQSYDLHGSIGAETPVELLQRISELAYNVGTFVRSADVIVITLGTAWAYRLRQTGELVNNCHKQSADLFVKELLTPDEIINSLAETHAYLRRLNPKLRFILTISPVRHLKDTLTLNAVSKSVLRVAAHILSDLLPDVAYFPSYELLTDDLRDYRFYGADMLHPTPVAEDYVWDKFATAYFDADFGQFRREWGAVRQGLEHRPLYAGAPEHRQFLEGLRERLQRLSGQRVPVGNELREIQERLEALPPPRVVEVKPEDDGEERIDIGTSDDEPGAEEQPRAAQKQRPDRQPRLEQPPRPRPDYATNDPLGLTPITDASPTPADADSAAAEATGATEGATPAAGQPGRLSAEEFKNQRNGNGRDRNTRGGRGRGRNREEQVENTPAADAAPDNAEVADQEQADRRDRNNRNRDGRNRDDRRNRPERQPADATPETPVVLVTETQPELTEAEIGEVLDTAAALETAALNRPTDEAATSSLDPAPKKKKRRSRGGAKRTARKHAARLAAEQEAAEKELATSGEAPPVVTPTETASPAPEAQPEPAAPAAEDSRGSQRGGKKSSVITKSTPVKRGSRRPLYNEPAKAEAATDDVQPDAPQASSPSEPSVTAAATEPTAAIETPAEMPTPAPELAPVATAPQPEAAPAVATDSAAPEQEVEPAKAEPAATEPATAPKPKAKSRSRATKVTKAAVAAEPTEMAAVAEPATPEPAAPATATATAETAASPAAGAPAAADAPKPAATRKTARKPAAKKPVAAAKPAATKAAPDTGPTTESADNQPAAPAKKPATKKAPARPKASADPAVAEAAPAADKPTSRLAQAATAAEEALTATPAAAKKAVAKKTPAKKAPAKKASVKKAPAKKAAPKAAVKTTKAKPAPQAADDAETSK